MRRATCPSGRANWSAVTPSGAPYEEFEPEVHPPRRATALSTLVQETPAVHVALADFGGPVRVARYPTFGTPELAANCVAGVEGRAGRAARQPRDGHDQPDLAKACERAQVLEWV